jgi:hypothetical protein
MMRVVVLARYYLTMALALTMCLLIAMPIWLLHQASHQRRATRWDRTLSR